MTKIVITGATGNVGTEVISELNKLKHDFDIYAGVRNLVENNGISNSVVKLIKFDFTDITTYNSALNDCYILFLLRPPQISEVKKHFKPLIESCKENAVKHIVFLSVQGVEKSSIIPHHKIEELIVESEIPYTFLRPAYFMQNFTTTLRNDILFKRQIFLPAGKAKFTLVDVRDISAVSAKILTNVASHINKSYELTNTEKLTFGEIAKMLSTNLGFKIQFKSPSIINFFLTKRKEKIPTMLILVMIMLHYFPRFKEEPKITDCVEIILGRKPITFKQFIIDNKILLSEWRKVVLIKLDLLLATLVDKIKKIGDNKVDFFDSIYQ